MQKWEGGGQGGGAAEGWKRRGGVGGAGAQTGRGQGWGAGRESGK